MFDKCDSHKAEYWTVVWMHLGPGMCEGVYGLSTPSSVEKEELFFQKSWLHMHRVQTRERLGQVFEDIERKKKEAEDAKKGVLTKLIGYVSGAAGGGGLSSSTSTTTTTSLTDLDEDSPEEPLVASEDQKVRREEQDDQSTLKEEDFQDPEYASLIEALAQHGVRMDEDAPARGGAMDGETIVVTGSLERWSRNEVEDLIKSLGGKVTGAVSKKTSFVVAGEGGGSKRDKAESLGVEILDEEAFLTLLRDRGWSESE